ncbi:trypsin-like peptidase domain-containing protein, partial [Methylorubrum podarium]
MSAHGEFRIPAALQPKAGDYAYDLERALTSVVSLSSRVPADAFTAETLGTERAGNGVVIREDGLVLTIGYLVLEADSVWLTTQDGRSVPAYVVGYDGETGFGLVQALGRLD